MNDPGRTSQSIARSEEECENAAQTCLGYSTDLNPLCPTSPSSPVHLTLTRHREHRMLSHDSSQHDCVGSRSSCVRHRNSHSSYTLYTFHNHGIGARIGFHDMGENADWQNEHIGCGEVRHVDNIKSRMQVKGGTIPDQQLLTFSGNQLED